MTKFKIMLGAVLIVCIGFSGGWFFVANQIDSQLDNALNAPKNELDIQCENRSITGFPFRFDVRCTKAVIVAQDATFSLPKIEATALFYRPTHILAFLEGPIQYENAFTGSQKQLRFETANASVRADFNLNLKRISANFVQPVWSDMLVGTIDLADAEKLEVHLLAHESEQDRFFAYAKVQNANSSEIGVENFNNILEIDIKGLDQNVQNWVYPTVLQEFAARQGEFNITKFETTGMVTPLGATQPQAISLMAEGELTLTPDGYVQGVLRTSSQNIVNQFDLSMLGPVAGMVVGAPDQEGKHHIPILANAGVISLGMAPLYALPPLF